MSHSHLPRYMLPNESANAPIYRNSEQDVVRQAFSMSSFHSLSDLPDLLKHRAVNDSRADRIDHNVSGGAAVQPFGSYSVFGPNRLFSTFVYEEEGQSMMKEIKRQERLLHEAKMKGRKPFAPPSANPVRDKPPDPRLQYMSDPYQSVEDPTIRRAQLTRQDISRAPFVAVSKSIKMSQAHPGKVAHMVKTIREYIAEDWEDAVFTVYADEDDIIICEFKEETVDSLPGLLAFMNMLLNNNQFISENGLSKLVELWNHFPGDGSVYFGILPPFVRRSKYESYYVLHPEYNARKGKKGKSRQASPERKQTSGGHAHKVTTEVKVGE